MAGRTSLARGYTLLELTVVIAVFAMLAMIVIPSVQSAMGVHLREEAGKIGGEIRALYGEAALSGKTCRMVFDLDASALWAECAEGKVTVKKMEASSRGARVEEAVHDALDTDQDAERRRVTERGTFAEFASPLTPRHVLPEGVRIQSIWTQHQEEPYVSGKAYLYFFPQGQTEKAYLYLTDGDDTYTVIVSPVSGRTRVVAERVEMEK